MRILIDGNPILKKIAKPVTEVSKELRDLAAEMMATMHLKGGVGLAAPQIGRSIRLIVFDVINETMDARNSGFLFNPEIVESSEDANIDKEGCLSFPRIWVKIKRPNRIKVKFTDISGRIREEVYTGVAARVICHEIDHLNGITLLDYEKGKK